MNVDKSLFFSIDRLQVFVDGPARVVRGNAAPDHKYIRAVVLGSAASCVDAAGWPGQACIRRRRVQQIPGLRGKVKAPQL